MKRDHLDCLKEEFNALWLRNVPLNSDHFDIVLGF